MAPGTVEMVSVEWIMQNAGGSVDAVTGEDGYPDYLKMAQRKGSDPQFAALVSTIMENGFRVPIVLCNNYDVWGHGVRQAVHGNGHHRMIAAILLGLDEIPVYWSDFAKEMDFMCLRESETEPIDYTTADLVDGLWEHDAYEGPWGSYDW